MCVFYFYFSSFSDLMSRFCHFCYSESIFSPKNVIWKCWHGLFSFFFSVLLTFKLTAKICIYHNLLKRCWVVRLCKYISGDDEVLMYQYFLRHAATAVRVWLAVVTCGRLLAGHYDWINSHEKHAAGRVACSLALPSSGPRLDNTAAMLGIVNTAVTLRLALVLARRGQGLRCQTPAAW